MVFSSMFFILVFLVACYAIYAFGKSIKQKNIILLVSSLIFYAWGGPSLCLLLCLETFICYIGALIIDRTQEHKPRLAQTWVTVLTCIAILILFKYTGFFADNLASIFGYTSSLPSITLPIGISFYTFQILSYVIDVYRDDTKVQKNIIYLGTYLAAFPQLIAGPVVRYQTVAEELEDRTETLNDFAEGMRRFVAGLSKKVLIANTMGLAADSILANSASDYGVIGAWIGMIAYSLQIYFDFSGYSDMAIGMGRMMGFHYLENFNYPYIATSVTDFWRRWHISMSTFFRDYVYIPLGGNRVSRPRWIFNILVVWFLTGLWHGASWNFILWGVYFGVVLLTEKLFIGRYIEKIPVINHVYALICIIFGWVIFRAESVAQIGEIIKAMLGGYGNNQGEVMVATLLQRSNVNTVFFIVLAFGIILSTPISRVIKRKLESFKLGGYIIDVAVFAGFILSVIEIAIGSYNPFIYFRF